MQQGLGYGGGYKETFHFFSKMGFKSPAEQTALVTDLIIFSSLVNGRGRTVCSERCFCACLNTEELSAGPRCCQNPVVSGER